ncbi:acetoin utilization AcuB family protein [Neobacillus sp. MM2021_6]|uniref:acetoin utilization AcuB family protein n=1 Tax=Bacillaceae TaxID=186817 RepID=UPI00140B6D2C|nr:MULTISPECIES: acetoin utilization AcuB family protein [Bacillaceae]MBO0960354.1 acetoin utilization AcuB family protein [Neobacillus sp. MM2021_6]NHC17464.1 CBS domain-containing protein [Bacillus sp. MM2020_4]WML40864.1 acetoin utilization AcuB family protein [Neobacillus sp. OS1-2]
MIVEEIMKTDVATLFPTDTIADAMKVMETRKIRHIPIVNDEGHLVGLVTVAKIQEATPSIFHANEHPEDLKKSLATIMEQNIITGHPLDFVEEVAGLFYEHKISCIPIINDRKLVGIVTETDLLRTMVELTGAHQPGSQIEIKVPNLAGVLSDITTVIKRRKANILSVLVYPDKTDDHFKILVIRVQTMNPTALIQELNQAGHHVLWPNLPGISQ